MDLDQLFQLRAAVGRFGEMDAAGWWNTQGVLGSRGAAVYRRGLPHTHFLARVRLVASIAAERSAAIYPAPGIATLWTLPPSIERALSFQERSWVTGGSAGTDWTDFEKEIASPPQDELPAWLTSLGLLNGAASVVGELSLEPGGSGVAVPGPLDGNALQLLAAAHALGGQRRLVVPFVRGVMEDEVG